jgi:uncharacterized protein YuzE
MAKNRPKVRYDQDADILYIKVKGGSIKDTVDVAEDVFVEFDDKGNIAGIEVWRARELLLNPLAKQISKQVKLLVK